MNQINALKKINVIKETQMKIENYKDLIRITSCPICKLMMEAELVKEVEAILIEIEKIIDAIESDYIKNYRRQTQEFTSSELSDFNGHDGKPAYVAVNGIVYDVSLEATWGGASHFGLEAGKDLTTKFNSCHDNAAILSKLKKVGVLK